MNEVSGLCLHGSTIAVKLHKILGSQTNEHKECEDLEDDSAQHDVPAQLQARLVVLGRCSCCTTDCLQKK